MMRTLAAMLIAGTVLMHGAPSARAHAFLDHAVPGVGSSLSTPPKVVTLWFTQELEPAFSDVIVTNQAGQNVDADKAHVPEGHPMQLEVRLKPLPAGTYLVSWHVVSVDTHRTEGTFTFQVGGD